MKHKPGSLEESAQRVLLGESTEKKLQELLDKFFQKVGEGEYKAKEEFTVEYNGEKVANIDISKKQKIPMRIWTWDNYGQSHDFKDLRWLQKVKVFEKKQVWKG